MKMNKLSVVIGASIWLCSAAAFAGPINLNCPAGTKQTQTQAMEIGCAKIGAAPTTKFEGRVVRLHANGVVAEEGQQAKGLRVGTWTFFDEQGKKTVVVEFKESRIHGKRTEFFATGQVKKVEQYENDTKVAVLQEFDITGKAITTTAAATK